MSQPELTDPWQLAGITVPNRVLLAPLAGIGNWCVRLQAGRYGAGMAVSEMVSSFAVHHGNEKTRTELLRRHPDEGLASFQLFGQDPDVMRSAAAYVAEHTRPDVIDLNMGCPVPKVCKTGAGAAMLKDPDTAVAVTKAAREGSGLPVTVKLRSGDKKGDTSGVDLAHRLVEEAGAAAITFHPRSAQVHHKGTPDYDLAARLVEELPAPVILTGGLGPTADDVRRAYEHTGAAAVMLARGSLGNPWLFRELLGGNPAQPDADAVLDELEWLCDRVEEHMGEARAGRWLRKAYPWYVDRMDGPKALHVALQQCETATAARAVLAPYRARAAVPA